MKKTASEVCVCPDDNYDIKDIRNDRLVSAPLISERNAAEQTEDRIISAPTNRNPVYYLPQRNRVIVTFRSPSDPTKAFSKAYTTETTVQAIRHDLANLLNIQADDLYFTIDGIYVDDYCSVSNLELDLLGNIELVISAKNNEEIKFSNIPGDKIVEELSPCREGRENIKPQFVVVKFNVVGFARNFTSSYKASTVIRGVKESLANIFKCRKDDFVLSKHGSVLADNLKLCDLNCDRYGNFDVNLNVKEGKNIDFDAIYRGVPLTDVLTVTVADGDILRQINVEILDCRIDKPYLGGYRHKGTGIVYHHAYSQTPQKPENLPSDSKNERETQTAEEKEKLYDTTYSRSTQMTSEKVYIPNITDRIMVCGKYETHEEMIARLNHEYYAAVIQRAYRAYKYRQLIQKWLKECMERIARIKKEDEEERAAYERRLKKNVVTNAFPRTREDFDQLYAMVDRWKNAEIARITQLHEKGPKIAEFSLLLDKEIELLRCIESYRIKLKEDHKKIKDDALLEEISKPVVWFGYNGKLISMDTVEAQRSRKFTQLYYAFCKDDLLIEDRMRLLVDMKYALKDYYHPLTAEIIALLDRECELIVINQHHCDLINHRERIRAMVLQFIKTSELNSDVTRRKNVKDYRALMDKKLYLCEMCDQCKEFTKFPLHSKTSELLFCTSCAWKNVSGKCWTDMTTYKFILRAVQREERRRKCWGSLAFVLQDKDIYYIIEKLWHSHSVISEWSDMFDLRLCRWYKDQDWSPWNCVLVTIQEMKAHLKLDNPDIVYDQELVKKVKNKHLLAKGHFEQLISVNTHYAGGGAWHKVRAGATDYIKGVAPI